MKALDYEFSVVCSNRIRRIYGPDADLWVLADTSSGELKARGFRARDIKEIRAAAKDLEHLRDNKHETELREGKWRVVNAVGQTILTIEPPAGNSDEDRRVLAGLMANTIDKFLLCAG